MAEKYFAIKYFEFKISICIFIGILLIASLIDFIERHKKR